jgi:hypothetical protein
LDFEKNAFNIRLDFPVFATRQLLLRQHPPVLGLLLQLFCGLHADRTGLGEEHGLNLATAQSLVKMKFVGAV